MGSGSFPICFLSFSSFLAYQEDLQGTFPKESGTQPKASLKRNMKAPWFAAPLLPRIPQLDKGIDAIRLFITYTKGTPVEISNVICSVLLHKICWVDFPFVVFYSPRNAVNCRPSGSEKGVFWKRGLFSKVHFLEILENWEILENLENSETVENQGESDHFLEIPEILEIPPVKRPLS